MKGKKIIACTTALATVLSVSTIATTVATTKSADAITMIDSRELIRNNKFDNNVGGPWSVVAVSPARAESKLADGKYYVTVLQDGVEGRWDVQLRQRGLVIQQGHTYTVKFTVTADKDCYVYPKIGDQGAPFNEYWNYNNFERIQLKAGVPTIINQEFTMNSPTARTAEFAFHLAGDCKAETFPYTFAFDDIYLTDKAFTIIGDEIPEPTNAIRVNQVGYYTGMSKVATVVTKATTPINWYLKNSEGTVVKTGQTIVHGLDEASGDNIHKIDFSDYYVQGTGYTLSVDAANVDSTINDSAASLPFDIGINLYSKMQYEALKYFYLNRSGIPITMPYAENTALTHLGKYPTDILSNSPDTWYKDSYTLDISGGWNDIADQGKSVVNGGISVWTIMNQYERAKKLGQANVGPFADDTMNIPESGNGYPDILDEARFQMGMMLKMQIPAGKTYAGMVHHKVRQVASGSSSVNRYLEPPSTAATLNLAATAAQSARLWAEYDAAYANKCLTSAETAWAAALKNPEIYAPSENGLVGGTYGDDNLTDEFYWAASELYETTGRYIYLDYLKTSEKYLAMDTTLTGGEDQGISGPFDWGNVAGLGTISLAIGDKLDPQSKATARTNIIKAADVFIANTKSQGYGTPMVQGTIGGGVTGYPWGSNSYVANEAIVMGYAYDFTCGSIYNIRYLDGIVSAMDYLLGCNAMVQSYITGYGKNSLENPSNYSWAYQADNTLPKAPAGCLSSGPNSGLQDPWVKGMGWTVGSRPAAKCFVDNVESWSTNLVAVNYNAPLAWVTSYLSSSYIPGPPGPIIIRGDANNDQKINAIDLAVLKKYILDNATSINTTNADMNRDGNINAIDLALLKKILLA